MRLNSRVQYKISALHWLSAADLTFVNRALRVDPRPSARLPVCCNAAFEPGLHGGPEHVSTSLRVGCSPDCLDNRTSGVRSAARGRNRAGTLRPPRCVGTYDEH